MKWGSPDLLLWLWLCVPAAWLVLRLHGRRERLLRTLVAGEALQVMAPRHDPKRTRNRNLVWIAAMTLCAFTLARPQWGFRWEEVRRRGLDVLVVLDTSKSMLTEDIKPNRLQQAKWGIRDLVWKLQGDRIGLIAFAGSSFLQCPLTIDYAAFLMTLDDVYVGLIPRGGTAVSQALRTAINSFEENTQADRAIVLITDGEDHEGNPLDLLDDLKEKNIRVYAIGVGTLEGELVPAVGEDNRQGFLKNRDGEVVKSSLREDALQRLALGTGGTYVRSAPGDFGLDRVYEQGIAQLRRDEQESRMVKAYEDRFGLFLAGALVLLAIEAVLGEWSARKGRATS
ncbi:MAG: VWA domain-containing protein [Kiritimatiellae bacterium]|nr:VWA domain-containing protein [Kiritimatiellia bacterium]